MWTRSTMGGQYSTKMVNNTEARYDKAVKELDTSGKQLAHDIATVFRHMDNNITMLKSDKEFLSRHLQRMTTQTRYSPKESTQTETDNEVSLSVMNESLNCRNQELEQKVLELEEELKQDGTSKENILTAVACNVLLPPSGDDKYIPTGTEQQKHLQWLQMENEQVLKNKDCLNAEIKRLGEEVYQFKNDNEILQSKKAELEQVNIDIRREMGEKINRIEQLQNQITELEQQVGQSRKLLDKHSSRFENRNADYVRLQEMFQSREKEVKEQGKRVQTLEQEKCDLDNRIKEYETNCSDHLQQIQRKDDKMKELENSVLQIENQYTIRGKDVDEMKKEIEALKSEVNQKESELSNLRRETEQSVKKLRNQLSLEAVKSQNGKIENDELCQTISELGEEISDLKLNNNKLETDLEIKEANITQERNKLHNEIVELQSKETILNKDYTALTQTCHTLEKEIEKHTTKERVKKYVSFHCVLKQPQSDQAISGIVSLLQQKFEDVEIEIIPESKRSKNVPLFVVLYNLSRLTDDATGALIGIEASPDVALVVLHSKEIKKASEQVLTLPDFKKLGIIVDMSFISAKGLIHNELTSNAVNQLARYLNKY